MEPGLPSFTSSGPAIGVGDATAGCVVGAGGGGGGKDMKYRSQHSHKGSMRH